MENGSSKKNISYDLISKYRSLLMGLAIIMIVFFHFTEDCSIDQNHYAGFLRWYYLYIGSGFVDVFLLLSGFGLYYSSKKKQLPLRLFYQKRLLKIILPYLICAVPALVWRDIFFEGRSFVYFLSDTFFLTFFSQGRKWFWYILAICICYLIFPYIFQTIDSASDDNSAQMRVLVWFCFINILILMTNLYAPEFFNNTNIVLLRVFPFVLGTYLGRAAYKHKAIHPGVIVLCCLSVPLLYLRSFDSITLIRYTTGFFSIFISLLVIIIMEITPENTLKRAVTRVLEFFGNYTLELYLSHVMIRGVMRYIGFSLSWVRYEIIMVAMSLLCAVFLKVLTGFLFRLFQRKAPVSGQ